MKFRKLPVIVDAWRWNGESDSDKSVYLLDQMSTRLCNKCGVPMNMHGWVSSCRDKYIICPGDWIVKNEKGDFFPCKPDIFKQTYEPVEDFRSEQHSNK